MADPLNAVVDLSHHNGNIDLQQAAGARGNIPTAQSVPSHKQSPVLVTAIETSSTALKINYGNSG